MSKAKWGIQKRSGGLLGAAAGGGNIAAAAAEIRHAAMAGLEDGANDVLDEAKAQTPVLGGATNLKRAGQTGGNQGGTPGQLRDSGHVMMEGDRAAIRFEGIYASLQHERMDYQHTEGGNAKFLERPLIDMREQVIEAIAAEIRKVTGG